MVSVNFRVCRPQGLGEVRGLGFRASVKSEMYRFTVWVWDLWFRARFGISGGGMGC